MEEFIHSTHLRRVLPDDATVAMKLLSDRRHELSVCGPGRCVACTGCGAS